MKKISLILFLIFISGISFAKELTTTYANDKMTKFGLKKGEEIITEPIYSKLIRLRDESFLFCLKRKYGIISSEGEILVEPKYSQAQRFIGKYAKLGSGGKYAIFDETGDMIIDREYSSINLLFGRMFLVCKNFKYGLISFDGDIILAPVADDIYMPNKSTLKILYDGFWYTIEQKDQGTLEMPDDILGLDKNKFNIISFLEQPITSTGYGIVSFSDYLIKVFSSISPAYEQTIDELVLSYGADTASILIKSGWLVKFPFVYSKNYFNNLKASNNGPLNDIKTSLRHKLVK